jgi:hypothetical protein
MSISIGSNFLYQGKKFLDDRIEIVKKAEDLKNWDIPIPDGFEVFVEGSWYMFSSNNPDDPVTGKFKKRFGLSQDFGRSKDLSISQVTLTGKFLELENTISKLSNELFPLTFKSLVGGGSFEVGSKITPSISWVIHIKGSDEILKPDYAEVNNSTVGISSDYSSWKSNEVLKIDTANSKSYKVLVAYNNMTLEDTVTYNFLYKKFYGTSTKPILETTDILKLTSKFITGNSYTLPNTKFDCSGGKYPYYILPKSIYKPSLEFWVGGLKNSDLVINEVKVTTSTGLKVDYVTIRLRNIQTGNLSIEIK